MAVPKRNRPIKSQERANPNWSHRHFKSPGLILKAICLLAILRLLQVYYGDDSNNTSMLTIPSINLNTAAANNNIAVKDKTKAMIQQKAKISLSDPESCDVSEKVLNKFNEIYREGFWGPKFPENPRYYYSYAKADIRERQSISGGGSKANCMSMLGLEFLSKLILEYNITSMMDIPCGDVNWQFESWEVDSLPHYVGADVSSLVIDLNQKRFAHHSNKEFVLWDLTACPLPKLADNRPFDLIHTRDVLQHLPLNLGQEAIQNIKDSQARYLVTTTFPNVTVNRDIKPGRFYENNLNIAPFNFPPPLKCIESHSKSCGKEYEPDLTCLYDLNEMRRSDW